jgi:hypothetical protein
VPDLPCDGIWGASATVRAGLAAACPTGRPRAAATSHAVQCVAAALQRALAAHWLAVSCQLRSKASCGQTASDPDCVLAAARVQRCDSVMCRFPSVTKRRRRRRRARRAVHGRSLLAAAAAWEAPCSRPCLLHASCIREIPVAVRRLICDPVSVQQ